MQDVEFINGLLDFIKNSPTPFHAVNNMSEVLELAGFVRLQEADEWSLQKRQQGDRFYITRNDSSIIAFQLNSSPVENGIRMIGAHTDSPCLKVKPTPEIVNNQYLQLGVEVYGGALLNPWFDRDLSLAGKVSFLNNKGAIDYQLINLEKPIAIIPSLAIHLDREANASHPVDQQKHLPPVLMKMPENGGETKADFREMLLKFVNADIDSGEPAAVKVLDYELSFYDVQPPAVIGLHDDFISSARLDNLLSCYTALVALLGGNSTQNTLLVCNDHEEVGSISAAGAQGTFLRSVLERMCNSDEEVTRMISNSVMISADNAHGIHPNYADKHDANR
jgi:aspartyl aminopeptidase